MIRHLFIILIFPLVVCVGVLLQSVLLVGVFLLAEIFGLESFLNNTFVSYAFFVLAVLVSLYGSWRVSRRMWSPQVVTTADPDTPAASRS